jgi:hypothetical protein
MVSSWYHHGIVMVSSWYPGIMSCDGTVLKEGEGLVMGEDERVVAD